MRGPSIKGLALAGAVIFSAALAGCATQPEMAAVPPTKESRVPFPPASPPVKPEPVKPKTDPKAPDPKAPLPK